MGIGRFDVESGKTFDCQICDEKAKKYVKGIYDTVEITGRQHRKDVALEIATRMKRNIVDEFGKPFFKPEEILCMEQIDTLLYDFKKKIYKAQWSAKKRESAKLEQEEEDVIEQIKSESHIRHLH